MPQEQIIIKGASEHNLKHIDLAIPRNRLVVITGLSGSGKSSLAFDTIYAEGQRRYVESLSAYARQFLEQMEKPDVELIEGLSPAISIEQKTTSRNPRSTVGTVTEIYDYLRLLFARVGLPHCHKCGRRIASQTVQQIVDQVMAMPPGSRIQVLAPIVRGRKGEYRKDLQALMKKGFVRVRIDGKVLELSDDIDLDKKRKHSIEVVVDRLVIKEDVKTRLTDSMETALQLSEGLAMVNAVDEGKDLLFSEKLACSHCGISVPDLAPRAFSFNSPYGACPECGGLGARMEIDPAKLIPDPSKSILEGCVEWTFGFSTSMLKMAAVALSKIHKFDPRAPWQKLPRKVQEQILRGTGEKELDFEYIEHRNRYFFRRPYEGVIPNLMRRYRETTSPGIREAIEQYMSLHPCTVCKGERLKPESLAVKVAGHSITHYTGLTIQQALKTFAGLPLAEREEFIAHRILKEIRERLGFLENVGLGYLTLDRTAATLSGGEGQRIRLATQIGSRLTGVLYVLDEPSIGLHQRDNRRLLDTLRSMRDLGNTVIVVEHDEETIRSADHVIDLGPGAGAEGGRVVAQGTPADIEKSPESLTGKYLSGKMRIEIPVPAPAPRRPLPHGGRGRGEQPEVHRRPVSPGPPHRRHRGLGLRQEHAGERDPLQGAGQAPLPDPGPPGEAPPPRGSRADRQGDRHRPVPHRPHAPLQPGHLHRTVHAHPRAVLGGARVPRPGLPAGALLLQRQGGALRGLRGGRDHQDRDALPAGHLRHLRGVQGAPVQPGDAGDPLQGEEHRRGAGDVGVGGPGPLQERPRRRRQARDPGGGGARIHQAGPVGDHPLRRRGPADQAVQGALQARHGPHPLRPGRAHHRPPLRRHQEAARTSSTPSWTGATPWW